MQMTAQLDELTGALNLITHPEELSEYNSLVDRFRALTRLLSPIIEMECMSDYDYILEVYDTAFGAGQRVINYDFPVATTKEEFAAMTANLKDVVNRMESVDRVLAFCFRNNFIRFY
ncbi:unnamed protein product [Caenorhabditis sp. 36 PRJEB53466]|nr:unnamed protein product [Caenorhabditis sp. 36 PRJEB53466]